MNFPTYTAKPATEQNTIDALTEAALSSSEASHRAIQEARALARTREQEEWEATERVLSIGRK